jgi:hypothetical protein
VNDTYQELIEATFAINIEEAVLLDHFGLHIVWENDAAQLLLMRSCIRRWADSRLFEVKKPALSVLLPRFKRVFRGIPAIVILPLKNRAFMSLSLLPLENLDSLAFFPFHHL